MELLTPVMVHASRYPGRVRAAYLESFRSRRMNHQFHYDTEKQAQQWLAIHEAYSPARGDEDCLDTYRRAFSDVSKVMVDRPLVVYSIGCGGGQKDVALLRCLPSVEKISYYATDVSLPLALTTHLGVKDEFSLINSRAAVLDIGETEEPGEVLVEDSERLVLFFGMLPNFEPHQVLWKLAGALRTGDHMLLSANLAPGADYAAGVQKVLSQYDNAPTRRWLATVLLDAGIEMSPEDLEFRVTERGSLKRIEAGYAFRKRQSIRIDCEDFVFEAGEWFQLFFSYRHTPRLLAQMFAELEIEIAGEWVTRSEEEGVFLLRKREA